MNRRDFMKALAAACLATSTPLDSPVAVAVRQTAPRWTRTLTNRIDLVGVPIMVYYLVKNTRTGVDWEYSQLYDRLTEGRLEYSDKIAMMAFIRAGAFK